MTMPGWIVLDEWLCLGAPYTGNCGPSGGGFLTRATQGQFIYSAGSSQFAPQTLFAVQNTFIAGLATLETPAALFFGSEIVEFDEMPEPAAIVLVGPLLILLCVADRCRSGP